LKADERAFRSLDFSLQIFLDAFIMKDVLAVAQSETLVICDRIQAYLALDVMSLN
jgi:hypothetical protein